jgi:hypothetical protein
LRKKFFRGWMRVSLKLHFDIAATESVQNLLYLSQKKTCFRYDR